MPDFRAPTRVLTTALLTGLLVTAAALPASAAELPDPGTHGPGIEDHAAGEPQTRCDPRHDRPGVNRFRELVMAAYPSTRDGGIVRECHVGGDSLHKEGRAWDWMLDAHDEDEAAMADELLSWLLATDAHGSHHARARRLGITSIIWDGKSWSADAPDDWQPYTGASPHTDHIHFGFSSDGADGRTSFWNPPEESPQEPVAEVGPALRGVVDVQDWMSVLLRQGRGVPAGG